MELARELIEQFVKITNDSVKTENSTIEVSGTARLYDGKIYVQLDGSDQLTPIESSTAGMKDGDRVTVRIKDHSAIVTGNTSSPSVGSGDLDDVKEEIGNKITEVEILVADKVSTSEFDAEKARIDELVADNVIIKGDLEATKATIGDLEADNVIINEKLTATEADIEYLRANMLTVEIADIKYATIEDLEVTNADIRNLEADYGEFKELTTEKFTATDAEIENIKADMITVDELDAKYANIDFANIGSAAIENFFSKSGMIGDLVVGDGTITGTLVGVTIKGDLIEGGTVKADKLVVQGEDGLYYKLNITGETVETEQTDYNSLNGSIITAKSITATKISVDDLVAFGATIGGFKITESSLYSGVKESIDNTTTGVYMDDSGQFALGDQSNYLKYFYDETDDTWKLDISAQSIRFGVKGQTVEDIVNEEIQNGLKDVQAIKSTEVTYQASTSGTTPPTGSWSPTIPTVADGQYLWTRTVFTYTDDSSTVAYSVSKMGENGAPGTPGDPGEPGEPGEDGRGIKSTSITYQAGSSQTTAPTGTWGTTVPSLTTALPYLWTRTVVTYTDNSTSTSYSVSSTMDSVEVGGRNLTLKTANLPEYVHNTSTYFEPADDSAGGNRAPYNSDYGIALIRKGGVFTVSYDYEITGVTTAFTFKTNLKYASVSYTRFGSSSSDVSIPVGDSSGHVEITASPTSAQMQYGESWLFTGVVAGENADVVLKITNFKFEIGNKATDWTPAPEDLQQGIDTAQTAADSAQNSANNALDRVTNTEASIEILNNSISSLVTDSNGSSLMTQTGDGWTFNIGGIKQSIEKNATDINKVNGNISEVEALAQKTSNLANDIAAKTAYIQMTTYLPPGETIEQPCIELGAAESPFKMRITNTSIDFMEDGIQIAYVTNRQLYIQSSVVTDEMKIGATSGFIWKKRGNGNMGLRWVTS